MNNRHRILILSLLAVLVAGTNVIAQPPAKITASTETDNPAVRAVLELDPRTPVDLARAARVLTELDRPDLGKRMLRKLLASKPTPQQLADLAERFGTPMFINMANRKELLPEAQQLAQAVLAAANSRAQDPKRVAGLIAKLQDPSPAERAAAIAGLHEAHEVGVSALIGILADPARSAEHAVGRAALVEMGPVAIGPLLGVLERSDPRLMAQAIGILGKLRAREAAIYLIGPYTSEMSDPALRDAAGRALKQLLGAVPGRQQAVRLLTERAREYFQRRRRVQADASGLVEVWRWDAGKRACVLTKLPAEDAALTTAARLARDAFALAKDDPDVRRLYLATMLEAAAYEAGLDKPLAAGQGTAADEAAGFPTAVIEDVMQHAIDGGHIAAATAAAGILGRTGETEALLYQGARPSPLVRAATHGDRRLRIAALEAIVRLQPARPYAGSSCVTQSLGFFAASRGTRRAVVASPIADVSQTLAGMLAGMGYEIDTAATGRDLLRRAAATSDCELVLIDAGISRPGADVLVQQLRRDYRCADVRVGLIARSGYLDRARQIARRDPLTMAFSRPHTREDLAWQVQQLATLSPRTFVASAERIRQTSATLGLLAFLSDSSREIYDLQQIETSVLTALHASDFATAAAPVTANLGTPQSQRTLVNLASRPSAPLAIRKAAGDAFRRNIERHGILLTTEEIGRQYDRYNQSAELDADTQQVLGRLLDAIEAPTQAAVTGGAANKDGGEGS